jgi:hypothetical protein
MRTSKKKHNFIRRAAHEAASRGRDGLWCGDVVLSGADEASGETGFRRGGQRAPRLVCSPVHSPCYSRKEHASVIGISPQQKAFQMDQITIENDVGTDERHRERVGVVLRGRPLTELRFPNVVKCPVYSEYSFSVGIISRFRSSWEPTYVLSKVRANWMLALRRDRRLSKLSTSAFCRGQNNSFRRMPKVKRSRRLGFPKFVSSFWRIVSMAVWQSSKDDLQPLVADSRVGSFAICFRKASSSFTTPFRLLNSFSIASMSLFALLTSLMYL